MKKKKFSESEEKQVSSFLERAFVRLDAWFQWFNTTQSGICKCPSLFLFLLNHSLFLCIKLVYCFLLFYKEFRRQCCYIVKFQPLHEYQLLQQNVSFAGKAESSYYWHGRDNITIRQLNPQVLLNSLCICRILGFFLLFSGQ